MARPASRAVMYEHDGAVTADAHPGDNFIFDGVYADSYKIAPLSGPAGYYLDSVRVGERDVVAAEVQLSPGTLPITVEYRPGVG